MFWKKHIFQLFIAIILRMRFASCHFGVCEAAKLNQIRLPVSNYIKTNCKNTCECKTLEPCREWLPTRIIPQNFKTQNSGIDFPTLQLPVIPKSKQNPTRLMRCFWRTTMLSSIFILWPYIWDFSKIELTTIDWFGRNFDQWHFEKKNMRSRHYEWKLSSNCWARL